MQQAPRPTRFSNRPPGGRGYFNEMDVVVLGCLPVYLPMAPAANCAYTYLTALVWCLGDLISPEPRLCPGSRSPTHRLAQAAHATTELAVSARRLSPSAWLALLTRVGISSRSLLRMVFIFWTSFGAKHQTLNSDQSTADGMAASLFAQNDARIPRWQRWEEIHKHNLLPGWLFYSICSLEAPGPALY